MSFTEKELRTIDEVQVIAKQLRKLDTKLRARKVSCDKASSKYKEASQLLEQDLNDRHELIQQMGSLKLKLMREMREYESMPTLSKPMISVQSDQIGRDY